MILSVLLIAIICSFLCHSFAGKPEINLESSVLVTGAAGFIGSQLVIHLKSIGIKTVVGLDTFNAYYSPALKRSRAKLVQEKGQATVVDGDICDSQLLSDLFEKYKFTHVVHLAAQAGVRYSLKKPLTYVRENIQCFVTLMETIRAVGTAKGQAAMPHFLYASSSSVYGLNEKIPFAESDPVEKPSNLYGATKRANELMAYSYYHLFGVNSIGFRFFTVYGPWGRPDMAAYIFADRISRGQQITVFNQGNMKRDFTYVDDIVDGLTSSLFLKHEKPLVLNLGNNQPVETMYFVQLVEKLVGAKANIRFEESKAEIAVTFANTTLAHDLLGFKAKTSIEEGLEKFLSWFREYESKQMPCASECAVGDMCFKSDWDSAAVTSRKSTEGCEVVLYTADLGKQLRDLHPPPDSMKYKDHCSVAFVSSSSILGSSGKEKAESWTLVRVGPLSMFTDLVKASKVPKISPGKFFSSSVKFAIYVDVKFKLKMDPANLIGLSHADVNGKSRKAVLIAVRHMLSKDVFAEASALIESKKDHTDPAVLTSQIKAYRDYQARENFTYIDVPETTGVLVHDLSLPQGRDFRCLWFKEYQSWGDMEQVAGTFAIGKASRDSGGASGHREEWIPVSRGKNKDGSTYFDFIRLLPSKDYHFDSTKTIIELSSSESN